MQARPHREGHRTKQPGHIMHISPRRPGKWVKWTHTGNIRVNILMKIVLLNDQASYQISFKAAEVSLVSSSQWARVESDLPNFLKVTSLETWFHQKDRKLAIWENSLTGTIHANDVFFFMKSVKNNSFPVWKWLICHPTFPSFSNLQALRWVDIFLAVLHAFIYTVFFLPHNKNHTRYVKEGFFMHPMVCFATQGQPGRTGKWH